jgi:hypothetical protein
MVYASTFWLSEEWHAVTAFRHYLNLAFKFDPPPPQVVSFEEWAVLMIKAGIFS